MKRLSILLLGVTFLFSPLLSEAQETNHTCGMQAMKEALLQANPQLETVMKQVQEQQVKSAYEFKAAHANAALKTTAAAPIPVVFHIVLNEAQIAQLGGAAGIKKRVDSQIIVLNRDFNARNSDSVRIPANFKPLYANAGIEFGLARRKADGSATDGYEIIVTTENGFEMQGSGSVGFKGAKYAATNGADAWDPAKYLNVWVINPLSNGSPASILGLCVPPSFSAYGIPQAEFGLVLNYGAFGKRTLYADYYISGINAGRTLTHEVGHYFELRHIWGDDDGQCPSDSRGADDGIADTPPQSEASFGCPTYPKFDNCSATGDGIMFMNYMDYVNDACMMMFTKDQAAMMQSNVQPGANSYSLTQHPELLQYPTGIETAMADEAALTVYPNPTTGVVYLTNTNAVIKDVKVYNVVGNVVFNGSSVNDKNFTIDLSGYPKGVYTVQCNTANGIATKRIVLQ